MRKPLVLIAAGASALASLFAISPAEAGQHGRVVNVQRPWGGGYVHSRQVSRQSGAGSVSRSTQTDRGYGAASTRNAAWGDGAYQGGVVHTFNNGLSASRSTAVQNNGDGSYSYQASRTGVDGRTANVSGTVQR